MPAARGRVPSFKYQKQQPARGCCFWFRWWDSFAAVDIGLSCLRYALRIPPCRKPASLQNTALRCFAVAQSSPFLQTAIEKTARKGWSFLWQITLIWIPMHPSTKTGCILAWGGVHLTIGWGANYCGAGCILSQGGVHFQGEGCILKKSMQPKERVPGIIYKIVHTCLLLAKLLYGIYRIIG